MVNKNVYKNPNLLKNFFKRLMFYEFVLTQKKDVFVHIS